jgi:hypothetical protein
VRGGGQSSEVPLGLLLAGGLDHLQPAGGAHIVLLSTQLGQLESVLRSLCLHQISLDSHRQNRHTQRYINTAITAAIL